MQTNYDPFVKALSISRVHSCNLIDLLQQFGYSFDFDSKTLNFYSDESIHDMTMFGASNQLKIISQKTNMNPLVYGQPIQREYEHSMDKQILLIDSIYNGRSIGLFSFNFIATQKFNFVTERKLIIGKSEHYLFDFECLDGKQRITTIIRFINNEFTDSNGYYFKDLNNEATKKFMYFENIQTLEFKNLSDEEKRQAFLNLNIAGQPMSPQHIEYVKSIEPK